jgi:hypothetical protein
MKRILLAVAVVAMAAVTAHAQSAMLVANVPFDFQAGAVQMKAGEYRVSQPGPASAIRIHKPSGSPSAFLLTNAKSAGSSTDCKLVFHRYGNEYFLAEVWPGYAAQVKTIRKSRRERELAQTIGQPVEHVLYARAVPQR